MADVDVMVVHSVQSTTAVHEAQLTCSHELVSRPLFVLVSAAKLHYAVHCACVPYLVFCTCTISVLFVPLFQQCCVLSHLLFCIRVSPPYIEL